ncbi:hypothetical protein [Bauldia sp.]|uniref:hypothetical protein n=1 Tax=Bauldia sp. TaxID=2575872 RepID=UPI003BAAC357
MTLAPIPPAADRSAEPSGERSKSANTLDALMADSAVRESIRYRIEQTSESLHAIAKDHGVPRGSLHSLMRQKGWTRPRDAPKAHRPRGAPRLADMGVVRGRLLKAVSRQIARIEKRGDANDPAGDEKDARTLVSLAKTLETLIALERDVGADQQTEPTDRASLRAALARRIDQWAEEGSKSA